MFIRYTSCLIAVFCIPVSIYAQVTISEVMYDLEGSDSGREWIEVMHEGGDSINLTSWKLYEAQTNHKITSFQGGETISSGEYAIIADNPNKFLQDNPSFSGLLFDSSFKLKQDGELLILRDGDLIDRDTLTYAPDIEADTTGESLQKTAGGWVSALPTPGFSTAQSSPPPAEETDEEDNEPEQEVVSGSVAPLLPLGTAITAIIAERKTVVVVGATTAFTGLGLGIKNRPLTNARYQWSFGDGSKTEGERVTHTYQYPGEYIVMLQASSGKYSATDRMTIKVVEADVVISLVGPTTDFFIELHNTSSYELNLAGWMLRSGQQYFTIPQDTLILPRKKLIIPPVVTQFDTKDDIVLLYPNGDVAYAYTGPTYIPKVFPVKTVPTAQSVIVPTDSKTAKTNITEDAILPHKQTVSQPAVSGEDQIATQEAAVLGVNQYDESPQSRSSLFGWLTATLTLIFIAIVGVVVTRKERNLADEFTVIEEKN